MGHEENYKVVSAFKLINLSEYSAYKRMLNILN